MNRESASTRGPGAVRHHPTAGRGPERRGGLPQFTGREELEELRHERPAEYERFQKAGGKGWIVAEPPPSWILPWGRAFGAVAIVLGLSMLVLILWAIAA